VLQTMSSVRQRSADRVRRAGASSTDKSSTSTTHSSADADVWQRTNDEATRTGVVAVDVTGTTFTRQTAYLHSLAPSSQLPVCSPFDDSIQFVGVVRNRAPSPRLSSVVANHYGFALARQAPSCRQQQTPQPAETTNRPSRRATSETREYRRRQPDMMSSSNSSAGQPSRGRPSVRQLKRRNSRNRKTHSDNDSICSWRHSLCAGFKSSKCNDMEDAVMESRPTEPVTSRVPSTLSSVTVSVAVPSTPTPSRSHSLPRSFRTTLIAPLRRLLSSRSLNSASEADTVTVSRTDERPSRVTDSRPTTSDAQPITTGSAPFATFVFLVLLCIMYILPYIVFLLYIRLCLLVLCYGVSVVSCKFLGSIIQVL